MHQTDMRYLVVFQDPGRDQQRHREHQHLHGGGVQPRAQGDLLHARERPQVDHDPHGDEASSSSNDLNSYKHVKFVGHIKVFGCCLL